MSIKLRQFYDNGREAFYKASGYLKIKTIADARSVAKEFVPADLKNKEQAIEFCRGFMHAWRSEVKT